MPKIIATAEAENNGEIYTTKMQVHQHASLADELPEFGGKDSGPAPGDYLCMAVASCKVITVRMYAQRKNWKVDLIKVKVNLVKGNEMPSGNQTFVCELSIKGDVNAEQQKRLLEISKACPIQRLISKGIEVETTML